MKKYLHLITVLFFLSPSLSHAELYISILASCVDQNGEKFTVSRNDIQGNDDSYLINACYKKKKQNAPSNKSVEKIKNDLIPCDDCNPNFKHTHQHQHKKIK